MPNTLLSSRALLRLGGRVSPSTEKRNHYSGMAEHYSSLAEAEELGTLAYGHFSRFDSSDLRMASRARHVPLGRRTPGPSPPRTPLSALPWGHLSLSVELRGCPRHRLPADDPRRPPHVGCMESSRTLSRPRGGVSRPRRD